MARIDISAAAESVRQAADRERRRNTPPPVIQPRRGTTSDVCTKLVNAYPGSTLPILFDLLGDPNMTQKRLASQLSHTQRAFRTIRLQKTKRGNSASFGKWYPVK